MAAINEITGDSIQTKTISDSYRNNYDLIFRKNKPTKESKLSTNCTNNCDENVSCNCDVTVGSNAKKP